MPTAASSRSSKEHRNTCDSGLVSSSSVCLSRCYRPVHKDRPYKGRKRIPIRCVAAASRALAAIQKAQATWYTTNKQVCASCHHQYQPALAYRVARDHRVPFDEAIAQADAIKAFTFADIDRAIQYTYVIEPAMDDAYRMVAANAAGVKPNLGAAVYARLLISRQNRDGDWDGFHQRPPSSYSRFTMAALGLRAVQLYHHPSQKAQAEAAVARARKFLERARRAGHRGAELSADRPAMGWRRSRDAAAAGARPPGDAASGRRLGLDSGTRQRRLRDRAGAGRAARRRQRRRSSIRRGGAASSIC